MERNDNDGNSLGLCWVLITVAEWDEKTRKLDLKELDRESRIGSVRSKEERFTKKGLNKKGLKKKRFRACRKF